MEITIYKETKYNKGRSKCKECKDPFEDGTKQLKTGYNDGKLCFRCGRSLLEAKIEEFTLLLAELTRNTEIKTSENERAIWWIANGEVGESSKTIWNCLMGNKNFPINIPYDPDDFSRCYKLLQIVWEWKKKIHKLKSLSIQWKLLIEHWSELTVMYEKNVKENWKFADKIGMYEFMKELRDKAEKTKNVNIKQKESTGK